jgi:hypothetical protein
MPFSNPATLSAPIEGSDFFTWPCIANERFAPTLGAGCVYSSNGLRPSVQCTGSGGAATWPAVPSLGPSSATFTGYTLTGFLYVPFIWASAGTFNLSLNNGTTTILTVRPNGTNPVQVYNGAGMVALTNIPSATWVAFTISVAANGKTTYTVNGVTSPQYSTAVPTTALQLKISTPADGGADALSISGLNVTYN